MDKYLLYKAFLAMANRPAICIIHCSWSKLNWAEQVRHSAVTAGPKRRITFTTALISTAMPFELRAERFTSLPWIRAHSNHSIEIIEIPPFSMAEFACTMTLLIKFDDSDYVGDLK